MHRSLRQRRAFGRIHLRAERHCLSRRQRHRHRSLPRGDRSDDPRQIFVRTRHDPKANPANELFAGTHPSAPAFQTEFTNNLGSLLSTNVNRIALRGSDRFNEFESVSQRTDVAYRDHATPAMRSAIQRKLTSLGSTLSPDDVLARATTQTCAGCHQLSSDAPLGGGKTWPSSSFFVHVDEQRNLSPALTGTFLPHRKRVLEKFINDRCGPTKVAAETPDPDSTVGGGSVGAAN